MSTISELSHTPSSGSSGSKSTGKTSLRGYTINLGAEERRSAVPKRIVVCCDGTWQDGLECKTPFQYTNVLKIARAINPQDSRMLEVFSLDIRKEPVPQVVFYQSGVGTTSVFLLDCLDGAVGSSLRDKVEEAYAFIASNYQPLDEIFLFGFSRGAYTARMVATIIGEIGILDKRDMSHFSEIFDAYQERTHAKDKSEGKFNDCLARYTNPRSPNRLRADPDGDKFSIKFIGVFDTVGALGLPTEMRLGRKPERLFGFPDKLLGEHIQYAYQALAINETREDFIPAAFRQTERGREKGQVLKQVWFSGCHTDIGGGYHAHDLSDITLMWMASHVERHLSLDLDYILTYLPQPVDSWGQQPPHDSKTGLFTLASASQRKFPSLTSPEWPTFEGIHPSVLCQKELPPPIEELIKKNADIVCDLQPLELEVREYWHKHVKQDRAKAVAADKRKHPAHTPSYRSIRKFIARFRGTLSSLFEKVRHTLT